MPQKRPSRLEEDPVAASSSSGEEDEESEAEEEGFEQESDEEENGEEQANDTSPLPSVKKQAKKPESAPSPVVPQSQSASEDEEEEEEDDGSSDSDSGSDSDPPSPDQPRGPPRVVDPNVKPIISKPMDASPVAKKPVTTKPAATGAAPAASPIKSASTGKRLAQTDKDEKDSKRRKKKSLDASEEVGQSEETDKRKLFFQRLWSDDDEIIILKGMHDYYSKKGIDPTADVPGFLEFIKKSLHVDVNKNQLADKIRRLKKKYHNNVSKSKGGEDPVFSKPHEHKSFELSKKVWGSNANDVGGEKAISNGKKGKSQKVSNVVASPKPKGLGLLENQEVAVKAEEKVNGPMYPYFYDSLSSKNMCFPASVMSESIIKEGLSLIGSAKVKELEEKSKKLHVEEMEVYLKRLDFVREQTKLILDAVKSTIS